LADIIKFPGKYLMAICEEEWRPPNYALYFINNSSEEIEVLVCVKGAIIPKIKPDSRIDDIKSCQGIDRFEAIDAKSYLYTDRWFDWDFDWYNERLILLRTKSGESRMEFYFEKYFIIGEKENIPIMNQLGWICHPKKSGSLRGRRSNDL
jgi:hypothetical protein